MASAPNADFGPIIASVAAALKRHRLPFMLIGGQAVLLHGEARLTQDIDVTLSASPDRLIDVLAACEAARLNPLPEDAEQFVRETFVLPAEHESGVRVDFIFSVTPYEAQAIERAVGVEIGGTTVPVAGAEDLILHKLFAGRPRDLEDAAGVVRRKRAELDWDYLRRWAAEFSYVPGRDDLLDQLDELQQE
jgi:predicted nucleotidyltransferase